MITVTNQPSSPLFTSALDSFSFKIGGERATVTITCEGEELLSETYYPVAGTITIYDLGTLISDAVRTTVVAKCAIKIVEHNGESDVANWSCEFTAYYATVDINMSCQAFLDQYFLTLLDGAKLTQLGHREYLHAAGAFSNFIFEFSDLQFPAEGNYQFSFKIGNVENSIPLKVYFQK